MNLTDLRIFASVASHPSLGTAALDLHLTPSAVSKALKRLEADLGRDLFDRSARQLVLNTSGSLLLARAQALLALADQARSDVMGEQAAVDCRIGGPAMLLWRHGRAAARAVAAYPGATLRLQALFEDEALAALQRGDIGFALVTGAALGARGPHWLPEWEATPLGSVTMQLAAGESHPLLAGREASRRALRLKAATVLAHDFACPAYSPFGGQARGARADGWRDDQLPRRIRYWCEDLQVLLGLVRDGLALAYLPDFALADARLRRIHVGDCPFDCVEQVVLVWNRARAAAWQHVLAETLAETPAAA